MGCNQSAPVQPNTADRSQPVLVVGEQAPSVENSVLARRKLMQLEERFDALVRLSHGLPKGPKASHVLATILRDVSGVAPMRVIALGKLRAAVKEGNVEQLNYESTVDVSEIDPNVKAKIILISHRWWSSTNALPDRVEDGWPKVRFVCEALAPRFCSDAGCDEAQIFIWWDFLSINQTDSKMKVRQIECLPIFVAMADSVCALRAGDENFHAVDGPRHPKTLQPYKGSIEEHPGHYNNRVWTAVELYCATSPFVRDFAGCNRQVYTVDLGRDFQPTCEIVESSASLRSKHHEAYDWTLPPRTNLDHQEDLFVLEPVAVILRSRAMPRCVTAAMCDLKVALRLYLDAGYDVNAKAAGSGATALHCAARRADTAMITILTGTPDIDVNECDKVGNTALHELAQAPYSRMSGRSQTMADGVFWPAADKLSAKTTFDFKARADDVIYGRAKAAVKALLKLGADPTQANNAGRSALDIHADFSDDTSFFPGYEKKMQATLKEARQPKRITLLYPREKLAAAVAEANITHSKHERTFESGNVVGWEEMRPTNGEVTGVILLHNGAGMSVLALGDVAYHLCKDSGFRVCMFDNPGAGRNLIREGGIKHIGDEELKRRFLNESASSEEMIDYLLKDIEVIVEEIVLESKAAGLPVHGAGVSLGALFMSRFAIKHTDWYTSLTLFGMVHGKRQDEETKQQFKMMGGAFSALPIEELKGMIRMFLSGMIHPSATEQMLELGEAAVFDGDMESRSPFLPMMVLGSLSNVLEYEKISCPTFFVTGEADNVYMEHAELVMQKLPRSAGCTTLPRVAHAVTCENPQLTSSTMLNFLRRLERD